MAYINGKKVLSVVQTQNVVGTMEEIKDANGNLRFIEGEGEQSAVTGLNIQYKKWSLSGSHLMFVVFGTIDNGTTLAAAGNGINVVFQIPEYVYTKIKTLQGTAQGRIEMKDITVYSEDLGTTQTLKCSIYRANSNRINVNNYEALTATAKRIFRIQFDLLIDNE